MLPDPSSFKDAREVLVAARDFPLLGPLLACLSQRVAPLLIRGEADPLPAIAMALGLERLDAVHLVGTGAPGIVTLTRARALDAESARSLPPARTPRLEINIWASHAGAGTRGRHFLQVMAEATRARILASDAVVGGPDAGASWDLPVAARPRVAAPFSRPARDALRLPAGADPTASDAMGRRERGDLPLR